MDTTTMTHCVSKLAIAYGCFADVAFFRTDSVDTSERMFTKLLTRE